MYSITVSAFDKKLDFRKWINPKDDSTDSRFRDTLTVMDTFTKTDWIKVFLVNPFWLFSPYAVDDWLTDDMRCKIITKIMSKDLERLQICYEAALQNEKEHETPEQFRRFLDEHFPQFTLLIM